MIERETVRKCPDRKPYIKVELESGTHVLKTPSLVAMADLLAASDDLPALLISTAGGVDNVNDALGLLSQGGPRALRAVGALVGMAWHHPTLDLESEQGASPLEWGGAVYDELHAEGYSFSDIVCLALVVLSEVWAQSQISAEVATRANFFLQPQAPSV